MLARDVYQVSLVHQQLANSDPLFSMYAVMFLPLYAVYKYGALPLLACALGWQGWRDGDGETSTHCEVVVVLLSAEGEAQGAAVTPSWKSNIWNKGAHQL